MLMASKILSIAPMVQSSTNTWVLAIILPLSIAEREAKGMLDPPNHLTMAMDTKYILHLIINLLITILNLNTTTHLQPIMKFLILVDFQLSTSPQDSEAVFKDQTMPTLSLYSPNINFNLFSLIIIVFLCIYNNHNNCHFSINFAQPAIKEMF